MLPSRFAGKQDTRREVGNDIERQKRKPEDSQWWKNECEQRATENRQNKKRWHKLTQAHLARVFLHHADFVEAILVILFPKLGERTTTIITRFDIGAQ